MGPGDFLKVTYHGRNRLQPDGDVKYDDTAPLVLLWDSRPYTIKVKETGFVPFEAVSVAMGDPRSAENVTSVRDESGNVGFVVDRATEVRRLRVLYDNRLGDEGEILYAPDATVTDLENNEVKTVLDDPEGDSVTPAQTTVLDREQLMAQIQRQQRLIEQLADDQGIELPSDTDVDTTTDKDDSDPFESVPEG